MSNREIKIIWCAVAVIIVMILFPPWKYTYNRPHQFKAEKPGPYAFLLDPPDSRSRLWSVKVDFVRLGLQIAIIVLILSVFLVTSRIRATKNDDIPNKPNARDSL